MGGHDHAGLEPLRDLRVGPDEMIPTPYSSSHQESGPIGLTQRSFKPAASKASNGGIVFQLVCRILSILISVATVGLLASIVVLYNKTKHHRMLASHGMMMNVWPKDQNGALKPILILLAAAAIAAFFGLFASVWLCRVKSRGHKSTTGSTLIMALSLTLLGLYLLALIIFKSSDGDNALYSWSCSHKHNELDFENNNIGLGQVCTAMNAAWYMAIVATALELVIFLVIGAGCFRSGGRGKKTSFMPGRRGYRELGPKSEGAYLNA